MLCDVRHLGFLIFHISHNFGVCHGYLNILLQDWMLLKSSGKIFLVFWFCFSGQLTWLGSDCLCGLRSNLNLVFKTFVLPFRSQVCHPCHCAVLKAFTLPSWVSSTHGHLGGKLEIVYTNAEDFSPFHDIPYTQAPKSFFSWFFSEKTGILASSCFHTFSVEGLISWTKWRERKVKRKK